MNIHLVSCQSVQRCAFIIGFTFVILSTVLAQNEPTTSSQDPNFEQIFNELNILTRQQLSPPPTTAPARSERPTGKIVNPLKLTSTTNNKKSSKVFQLPANYDPNKLPKFSKSKPVVVKVNMTVLHVNLDQNENEINLQLEIKEQWIDRRLRWRKPQNKSEDDELAEDYDEDDEDGQTMGRPRNMESYLFDSSWADRIWHPISRLQNNAEILITGAWRSRQDDSDGPPSSTKQNKLKTLEQDSLIENILISRNESTANVCLALKLRINLPMYECKRDDSSLYPFDRVKCRFDIANALYDRRSLIYEWDTINWQHNGYQKGEFYLKDLIRNVESVPLLELDKDNNEHSTMRVEIFLKRQIGDYVLNVYLLHLFLLALCLATFWISISNIVIRLSLCIIVLIIIKFQTIQTLKDDRHIVSALSIWTFGLSCLVILSLLCHILSYYSVQHKWNDKILNRLITLNSPSTTPTSTSPTGSMDNDSIGNGSNAGFVHSLRQKKTKLKQNCLEWLNSIILNNSHKNEGYDKTNLVDIISRIVLLITYLLFVVIYFFKYVF